MGRSSTATHGKTSATLAFRRSVTLLFVGLRIFIGTQRSPYMGATTRPTIMSLGAEWKEVGSMMTELPGHTGALLGNFPHTRYSWSKGDSLSQSHSANLVR